MEIKRILLLPYLVSLLLLLSIGFIAAQASKPSLIEILQDSGHIQLKDHMYFYLKPTVETFKMEYKPPSEHTFANNLYYPNPAKNFFPRYYMRQKDTWWFGRNWYLIDDQNEQEIRLDSVDAWDGPINVQGEKYITYNNSTSSGENVINNFVVAKIVGNALEKQAFPQKNIVGQSLAIKAGFKDEKNTLFKTAFIEKFTESGQLVYKLGIFNKQNTLSSADNCVDHFDYFSIPEDIFISEYISDKTLSLMWLSDNSLLLVDFVHGPKVYKIILHKDKEEKKSDFVEQKFSQTVIMGWPDIIKDMIVDPTRTYIWYAQNYLDHVFLMNTKLAQDNTITPIMVGSTAKKMGEGMFIYRGMKAYQGNAYILYQDSAQHLFKIIKITNPISEMPYKLARAVIDQKNQRDKEDTNQRDKEDTNQQKEDLKRIIGSGLTTVPSLEKQKQAVTSAIFGREFQKVGQQPLENDLD